MFRLMTVKTNSLLLQLFALLAVSVFLACPTYGQVVGATLSGMVTDASGGIVPQAQISIKNLATGISTTISANGDGFYTAPNLLRGDYEIAASAPGFSTEVRTGITLTVGAQQVLNFTLQVGQVAQRVVVTGAPPAVELASSSIGAVVSPDTIVNLPLNGRDWTQLAALQTGVNVVVTQRPINASGVRGNRGFGNQMTVSGTRPQLNNYRLDGISIVDYSGGAPGSVLSVALGVDAVAEFSVLTANYSAEYGRTSGGVINAVNRSGSNQIHGNAYWFLRDEGFDARNYFDASVVPFHRNQFGGSLGGPIKKEKAFFFFDYEGIRQVLGSTNIDHVPSADARNGILHNDDGTTTIVTVDPLVKPFFGFYPLPNAGLIGTGNTGLYIVGGNSPSHDNFYTAKIDWAISEKDTFSGTWFYDKGVAEAPDALNQLIIGNTSSRIMGALEEKHVFGPSLVNTMRGGYSRVAALIQVNLQAINPLVTDTSLGSFPGLPAPSLSVPGLTDFVGGGIGPFTGDDYAWNSYQAYDDAFLNKGAHSLKFGFAFERMQHNLIIPSRPTGSFNFPSLEGFLTNQPNSFQGQLPSTTNPRGIRQDLFGGYIQDDWRWRPNLTLNLGLRYEAVTVPTDVHNQLSNLPTFTSPTPQIGSPYFNNPTKRNFEPRLGLSWDPFRDGKTAVRAAFGMFDALPLNYEFFLAEALSAPFVQILTATNLAPGSFPTGAADVSSVNPSKLQYASIEANPHRNYVMVWNLNVQRQLTSNTSITVGYVGNHGVHMLDREDDVNSVLPTVTPQGLLWPSPRGSGTKLNPSVGDIRGLYWDGDAEYNALEVGVLKRMSHGFQVQGSYTWGKGIDTGSASVIGDPFTNSISSLFFFCKQCRRGVSDFNIAHTLVANYFWEVPTTKNWGTIGSRILGGWEVGGIITAETGVPITPLMGGDPLGLNSNDPYDFPNRLSGPGCSSPVNPGNPNNYIKLNCFAPPNPLTLFGNAGRNSVIGPGLVTWDFSLFKNNRISERFNLQFRAEFFNILNRPNFATPFHNNTLFDQNGNPVGGAGSVDQTSTTARQIQFGLKLIW